MTGPEPDQDQRDPSAAGPAETLDEDRLGAQTLGEGVDPPEGWAEADKFGTTPAEQRRGESLDDRLAQEQTEQYPE